MCVYQLLGEHTTVMHRGEMEFGYLRGTLKFFLFCVEDFTGLDKCLCLT